MLKYCRWAPFAVGGLMVIAAGAGTSLCRSVRAEDAHPRISSFAAIPCGTPCGLMKKTNLVVAYTSSAGSKRIAIPSSMEKVASVQLNAVGNIVALGSTSEGITVVTTVNPDRPSFAAEFWTTNVGLSDDARYVAFTAFVSPHYSDSLFSDTMVYIYDTTKIRAESDGPTALPEPSLPVFPPELRDQGRVAVLRTAAANLLHVLSTNMKWDSDRAVTFLATKLLKSNGPAPDGVYPVKISLSNVPIGAGLGALNPIIQIGSPLSCKLPDLESWDFDSIMASCAGKH